ncbi:MAG: ATP-dependent zinc metalloprotease FtsH [Rectinemataceae bacterium]
MPLKDPKGSGIPPLNRGQMNYSLLGVVGALLLLLAMNFILIPKSTITMVDFSDFKKLIGDGSIKRVEMTLSAYYGFSLTKEESALRQKEPQDKSGKAGEAPEKEYQTAPVQDPLFVALMDSKGVEYFAVLPQNHAWVGFLVSWILPLGLMLLVWRILSRRMGGMGRGVMSLGKNKSLLVAEGNTGVGFDDVAGAEEAKAELVEVIDFLKHPARYVAIGGRIPKGVLLVGAPGTGKTLMARAVAGEAGVAFFKISGSEFVEMFVGVGAARVRDLFQQARGKAPCIIFIDELDAIGKSRAQALSSNDEREQTLNQLLVEMDGFDSRNGVILLAATNRPEVLDPALLRPGRFDRQVLMDKPDLNGREAILRIHSEKVQLDDSVNIRDVARRTPGFVGADLANLVNEAALLAVRAGREKVTQPDFDSAFERLVAGLEKKNRLINPKERKIVAYHETGHALVAYLTPGADPVEKISIVPRGIGALGYTMQLPTEDRFLMTEGELDSRIDVLLGGRAAEQLIFHEVSTGATNDLDKAGDIARRMVTDFGMSEKFRNTFLPARRQGQLLGDSNAMMLREYSEATQQYVDEESARIINLRYDKVAELLRSREGLIREIAEKLLEVEVLDRVQFEAIVERHR